MATTTLFLSNSTITPCTSSYESKPRSFLCIPQRILYCPTANVFGNNYKESRKRFTVVAVTQGSAESSKSDEKIPSWAKPDSDEPPPWARNEANSKASSEQGFQIPFYVYLLASTITAIAAIGSIFEYLNQRPAFGVLGSDSVFYAPLLGFFAFTGIPTSAFLWFKSVEAANKEAEEQDKRDGFL